MTVVYELYDEARDIKIKMTHHSSINKLINVILMSTEHVNLSNVCRIDGTSCNEH